MKNLSGGIWWRSLAAIVMFNLINIVCWAQDAQGDAASKTVKTTTTEHTEQWYAAPWVWIVGGAIVILLLVAILSGGRGSSRTTVTDVGGGTTTRTITTDSD